MIIHRRGRATLGFTWLARLLTETHDTAQLKQAGQSSGEAIGLMVMFFRKLRRSLKGPVARCVCTRQNLNAVILWAVLQLLTLTYMASQSEKSPAWRMNTVSHQVNGGKTRNLQRAILDSADPVEGLPPIPPLDLREQPGAPQMNVKIVNKPTDVPADGGTHQEADVKPEEDRQAGIDSPVVDRQKKPRVPVLLFTYMRGGSSFVGQLFRQNPQAGYFYEIEDGVYNALYDLPYVITPLDLTHYHNLTIREYPEAEKQYLSEAIYGLLTCDFRHVPAEAMVHPFFYARGQSSFNRYGGCIAKRIGRNGAKKCKGVQPECLKPEGRVKRRCYLHGNETLHTAIPIPNAPPCVQSFQNATKACSHLLRNGCGSREISVLKSVRIRMDIVETLLHNHPDVKVIHYLRDPRAIVVSRTKLKLLSTITGQKGEIEAKLLCEDIVRDLTISKNIQASHPGSVLTVFYEQFSKDPTDVAKKIYSHIGVEMAKKVGEWLNASTHANKDGGVFQTFRKNSTETAMSWEKHLSYGMMKRITKYCNTALKMMGPEYSDLIQV